MTLRVIFFYCMQICHYPLSFVHTHQRITLRLYICVTEWGEGKAVFFFFQSTRFACPLKGRWCRATAEVSASGPVKLFLSFTTGCSRPSFQTIVHPLLLCPYLLTHSLTLRYGPWQQAGLSAIIQPADSGGLVVNGCPPMWYIHVFSNIRLISCTFTSRMLIRTTTVLKMWSAGQSGVRVASNMSSFCLRTGTFEYLWEFVGLYKNQ